MLIGLTGKNGSGKGEAARFLKERGYEYRSLADVVRDEVRRRKKHVTRENLISTGNDLRQRNGAGVLAKRLLAGLEADRHYVIDSVRHPEEARTLQERSGFVLLNIAASPKIRFNRIKTRKRESDPKTFRDFQRIERMEAKSKVGSDQQLNQAIKLADHTIQNSSRLREFHGKIAKIIMTVAKKNERPGWDDYFLGIAKVVALRSNCVKRKVAAVLVKDKRVISTGYNGTPRGVKNCSEGGCPRCNSLTASGTKLEECLCSHGEENAITQAAYHGVNINGSTLYSTFSPCLLCTKMIINGGVREVVYNADYPLVRTALGLLKEAGIRVRKLSI